MTLAVTAALAGACQSTTELRPAPDVVKVALVVSTSGHLPAAGPAGQAANVAAADILSKPRPGGKRVSVQVIDDGSSAAGAQRACSMVAASGFEAVVGLESDDSRAACVAALRRSSIAYLAVGPGLTPCGSGIFFIGSTPAQRIVPFIAFLAAKHFPLRLAVVYPAGPAGAQLRSATDAAVAAAGGQIVAELPLAPGTPATTAQMLALAASRPSMVLDELSGADGTAFETQLGSTAQTSGTAHAIIELDPTEFPRGPGRTATGYVVSDYLSADPSAANLAWLAALQKRYGEGAVATTWGAETYDAVELIAAATSLAANGTPAALGAALRAVSFAGPRGSVQIEPQNNGFATVPAHIGLLSPDGTITQVVTSRPVQPDATCAP